MEMGSGGQKAKMLRTRPVVTKLSIADNSITLLVEKLKDHSKNMWIEIKSIQHEMFKEVVKRVVKLRQITEELRLAIAKNPIVAKMSGIV